MRGIYEIQGGISHLGQLLSCCMFFIYWINFIYLYSYRLQALLSDITWEILIKTLATTKTLATASWKIFSAVTYQGISCRQ